MDHGSEPGSPAGSWRRTPANSHSGDRRSAEGEIKGFSDLQVADVKGLLVDVDGIRPRSQTPHSGQVTAVAPHGLDDEDPPLGATGRLFDAVARLNDRVFE